MIIRGINLNDIETNGYTSLVDFAGKGWLTEDEKIVLGEIDRRFDVLMGCTVNPLRIDENGCVDLADGYYLHGIPVNSTSEEIALRRQYGLCCSEYFGVPESAKECSFCLSVTKTNNLESDSVVDKRYLLDENGKQLNFDEMCMSVVPEVGFIIDKSVTHRNDGNRQLNYFEYKKNKEAFIEKYNLTEKEIVMLETIDRYSVKANGVVNGMYRQSYDKFNWAAITGGVPPQFVVGIVVNRKLINAKSKFPWKRGSLSEREYVEKVIETARICGEMFNVPVFDDTGKIIYHAKESFLGEA